jgi:hypothetical protein
MEKMTEKNIRKALADSKYFATLPPANMMHVLVEDIIQNGDVKKKNFEIWLDARETWTQISQEEKMDEVIEILKLAKPTKALQAFQKMGFMAFCMPKCFPIKKLMDKKSFYAIIDHFDNCKNTDLSFRLNVLMFPFDPKGTRATMVESNLDPETVDWMMQTIENYMDYLQVKQLTALKKFLKDFGKEFYYYMDDYAQAIFDITRFDEFRRPDSRTAVNAMIKRGDPFEPEDLDITRQDLIDAGAESDAEVEALTDMLLDYCLKKPDNNIKPLLLAEIKKYSQSKIDKRVKALKKKRKAL